MLRGAGMVQGCCGGQGCCGMLWGARALQGAGVLRDAGMLQGVTHSKGEAEGQAGAALPSQTEEEEEEERRKRTRLLPWARAAGELGGRAALSTQLGGDDGFISRIWNQIF